MPGSCIIVFCVVCSSVVLLKIAGTHSRLLKLPWEAAQTSHKLYAKAVRILLLSTPSSMMTAPLLCALSAPTKSEPPGWLIPCPSLLCIVPSICRGTCWRSCLSSSSRNLTAKPSSQGSTFQSCCLVLQICGFLQYLSWAWCQGLWFPSKISVIITMEFMGTSVPQRTSLTTSLNTLWGPGTVKWTCHGSEEDMPSWFSAWWRGHAMVGLTGFEDIPWWASALCVSGEAVRPLYRQAVSPLCRLPAHGVGRLPAPSCYGTFTVHIRCCIWSVNDWLMLS